MLVIFAFWGGIDCKTKHKPLAAGKRVNLSVVSNELVRNERFATKRQVLPSGFALFPLCNLPPLKSLCICAMPALWLSVCFGRGHAGTQVATQIALFLQGDSGEIMILILQ